MKSPAESLPDWLHARARLFPHRLALAAGSERLAFGELDRRADGAARKLAGLGVREGARVALVLGGGAPFVVLTHALARLRAVMVPINTRLAPPEMVWCLRDVAPALVVCEAAAAGVLGGGIRILTLEELAALPEADASLRRRVSLAQVQGIIYTSATTGRPKGVMLTFGNHWWNAVGSALNLGLRADDCWLAPLPLYHIGGLAILWRSVIYGIPAIVHSAFDPGAVNREIDSGSVTVVSVVGTMLQRMLEERRGRPFPPSLRVVLLGGGPPPPGLIEACLEQGVPVAPSYGLTEAASQVATLLPDEVAARPGSSGRPLFPVEVRIGRLGDEAPREAASARAGEILVRGPTVTPGYADRPEETAPVLRGGWLHTGDVGHVDDDGYLYVADRRDDLVVCGGENVYPAEVEDVLRGHPAVLDAGVFGFTDPEWGQAVAAAIVLRPGLTLDVEGARAFCAAHLARYKVPKRIWFVEDLPRSHSGKLIRRALRALAQRDT